MKIKEIETTKQFPPLFRGLPKEVPFKEGDSIMVDTTNNPNYSLGKEELIGKKLIVDRCYKSDIGQMSVYIVWLKQIEGLNMRNPHLAHHFDFYEDK